MKRWILAASLVFATTSAWGQTDLADWDGRNWRDWGYQTKMVFVCGFLTCVIAAVDFADTTRKSEQISEEVWYFIVAGFLSGENADQIIKRLDKFYEDENNVTTRIWKAYFESRGKLVWWEGAHEPVGPYAKSGSFFLPLPEEERK